MNDMEVYGLISDIQLFSTGDGPGIRSTVFLKGCNLNCKWCHNPETICHKPQLLYYRQRCTDCGRCVTVCPQRAHILTEYKHFFNRTKCIACGQCAKHCTHDALTLVGTKQSVTDVFQKVLVDKDFYDNSVGGVTLSGGEPMLQTEFCEAFAKKCTESGISILIDTAANVDYKAFEKLLPYVHEYYVDLKGATEEDYRNNTGGSLALTVQNMAKLINSGANVTARLPIIPGYNDTIDYCRGMAEILKPTGVKIVHLLPFHKLCISKYQALGQMFFCKALIPPVKQHMQELTEAFNKDFNVSIRE